MLPGLSALMAILTKKIFLECAAEAQPDNENNRITPVDAVRVILYLLPPPANAEVRSGGYRIIPYISIAYPRDTCLHTIMYCSSNCYCTEHSSD